MDKHTHKWHTRYVTIEGVDCGSGMICDCGAKLRQDEVEDMINGIFESWQPETSAENLEVAQQERPHGDEPWALQPKYT